MWDDWWPRAVRQARHQPADVTLFTNLIEQEAFGLLPLEAMASECRVIATSAGGSSEYCLEGVNCVGVSGRLACSGMCRAATGAELEAASASSGRRPADHERIHARASGGSLSLGGETLRWALSRCDLDRGGRGKWLSACRALALALLPTRWHTRSVHLLVRLT